MSKIIIGLADDDDELRYGLRAAISAYAESPNKVFKKYGYDEIEFKEFTSARLIKNELKKNSQIIDLLILDHHFYDEYGAEDLSGFSVLPQLRKFNPFLPIILMTAENDPDEVNPQGKYADEYIYKDVGGGMKLQLTFTLERLVKSIYDSEQRNLARSKTWINLKQKFNLSEDIQNDDDEKMIEILGKQLVMARDAAQEESQRNEKAFEILKQNIEKDLCSFKIGQEALKFIVTGETLFASIKGSKLDASPIVISYSKALECILRNKSQLNTATSLGDCIWTIKRCNWTSQNEIDILFKLLHYRNNAAHSEVTTFDVVKKVRNILFGNKGYNNGIIKWALEL